MKDIVAQYRGAVVQPIVDMDNAMNGQLAMLQQQVQQESLRVNTALTMDLQLEDVDCCNDIAATAIPQAPSQNASVRI